MAPRTSDTFTLVAWVGVAWMWLWAGVMIGLWVLLIVVATWLVATRPGRRPPQPREQGREILAQRYARGEIGAAEYRERLGSRR